MRYYILYLIFNAINVFIIYKNINSLLYEKVKNKNIEVCTYFVYYLTVSISYILSVNPKLRIHLNIILGFILLFNYKIKIKNKIILLFNLYFILNTVDIFVALILDKTVLANSVIRHNSIFMFVIESVFYLILLKFISLLKIINKINNINNKIWLSLLLVPLISFVINIIFIDVYNYNLIYGVILIVALLLINIGMYLMYNFIYEVLEKDMISQVLEKENKLYEEQFKNTKKYIEISRKFKHDLEYHLIHIKKLINNECNLKAQEYIENIFKLQEISSTKFIDTGNYIIDNIVNFKLNEAFNKGIEITATAKIPYDIKISEFYIVSILGNIIQNAIEANEKLKDNKFIDFYIRYKLNKLFITISNRFNENIIIKENKLITTKEEKLEHGIGFDSIVKFVEKYNGLLEYKYNKDIFTVEILLFI